MILSIFNYLTNQLFNQSTDITDVPFNPLLLLALGILVSYTSRLLILGPNSSDTRRQE